MAQLKLAEQKKKQNLRILYKAYPYLQAMTEAHTVVSKRILKICRSICTQMALTIYTVCKLK